MDNASHRRGDGLAAVLSTNPRLHTRRDSVSRYAAPSFVIRSIRRRADSFALTTRRGANVNCVVFLRVEHVDRKWRPRARSDTCRPRVFRVVTTRAQRRPLSLAMATVSRFLGICRFAITTFHITRGLDVHVELSYPDCSKLKSRTLFRHVATIRVVALLLSFRPLTFIVIRHYSSLQNDREKERRWRRRRRDRPKSLRNFCVQFFRAPLLSRVRSFLLSLEEEIKRPTDSSRKLETLVALGREIQLFAR